MNKTIIILKDNNNNLLENEYEKIGLDMWQLISDKSSLLLVILLRSCSRFLSQIKTKEKERICKELQERCELKNPEKFCEFLKEKNGLISGSFVLSCILGWEFEYHDVDIYIKNYISIEEIKEIFKVNKWVDKGINISRDYYIYNSGKLSFILIKEDEKEFVKDSDLDVCKNYFDGEKIYISNIEKIIKKEDNYDTNSLITKIDKFHNYVCNNIHDKKIDKNNEKIAHDYIYKNYVNKRIEKYKNRGFKIKYDEKEVEKIITAYNFKEVDMYLYKLVTIKKFD